MTPAQLDKQLSSYRDCPTDGSGRPERRRALSWYLTWLLLDGESKRVVAMASRFVESKREIEAMCQRLEHCVTEFGRPIYDYCGIAVSPDEHNVNIVMDHKLWRVNKQ